jgi:cephalosporin-C deacetylase
MPFTDFPLETLRNYRPDVLEPADFDAFWQETLGEARAAGHGYTLAPATTSVTALIIEDLTFSGFNGEPIRAWVTRPHSNTPLPAVIEYVGYNGGRGLPGEKLGWAASGYVHVLMDTRGQGSGWGSGGDTPDPHGSGPATAGFMSRGITDKREYYYRRVYTDAALLVEHVASMEFVDANRIVLAGASQGGGIALAAAALVPGIRAVMPEVPFLSHFRRAVEMTGEEPFTEIARYLSVHRDQVESVFTTLSYFDGVNFARRISTPALFSAALMDGIVIPSTIFAAYNHLASVDRSIEVYPFNGHEGGQYHHWVRQTQWLPERLAHAL